MPVSRKDRRSGSHPLDDPRTPYQIDRDRILYSMVFRRLAGVTQVVSPDEGEIFHNRLTHSLKVAQIGRRLAENFLNKNKREVKSWGTLNADVVEAAGLAHDLGHPPFGHIAEEELNKLVLQNSMSGSKPGAKNDFFEGYEGNAQSLRIISELGVRRLDSKHGLDLTRATLNASIKYPWRFQENPKKQGKYGYYQADSDAFSFARKKGNPCPELPYTRSLEAQIMDWADDITYSVHDTEDFFRAGLIPLDRLATVDRERKYFLSSIETRYKGQNKALPFTTTKIQRSCDGLFSKKTTIHERFQGTREQQQRLYAFVSNTIARFANETQLLENPGIDGEALSIPNHIRCIVFLLKELTWTYVIDNPMFAATQLGQRRAIRQLFEVFCDAIECKQWKHFPAHVQDRVRSLIEQSWPLSSLERSRVVADTIASMTDAQAMSLFHRFAGVSKSSMLDW